MTTLERSRRGACARRLPPRPRPEDLVEVEDPVAQACLAEVVEAPLEDQVEVVARAYLAEVELQVVLEELQVEEDGKGQKVAKKRKIFTERGSVFEYQQQQHCLQWIPRQQ